MENRKVEIGVYLFLIKERKLLYLHKPNDPIWTCVGGRMIEKEEDPLQTLQRECLEEIGTFDFQLKDIFKIKIWNNGKEDRLGIFYYGILEDKDIKISREHDEFKFFSYEEAKRMLSMEKRGEIGIELINILKNLGVID